MKRMFHLKGKAKGSSIVGILILIMFSLGSKPASGASSQENFRRFCAQCHGFEGKGNGVNAPHMETAPSDLTNAKKLGDLTSDKISQIIAKGGARNELSPLMPPWGNTLSSKEINDLVKHIRILCKCRLK